MKIPKFLLATLFVSLAISACGPPEIAEFGTAKAGGTSSPDPAVSPTPEATPAETEGGPRSKGIDVSEFQGTINWTKVKAAGKDFAFIRVSDGTGHADTKFGTNWSQAKSAGLLRGAYQFMRASDDANAQANLLLSKLGNDIGELPATLDVEVTDGASDARIRSVIFTWVEKVKAATGREPIVYTSPGFWSQIGYGTTYTTLWVAHWGVASPTVPNSWNDWMFWQYSSTGHVDGIAGNVDLDEFHGALEDLHEYATTGAIQFAPLAAEPGGYDAMTD